MGLVPSYYWGGSPEFRRSKRPDGVKFGRGIIPKESVCGRYNEDKDYDRTLCAYLAFKTVHWA